MSKPRKKFSKKTSVEKIDSTILRKHIAKNILDELNDGATKVTKAKLFHILNGIIETMKNLRSLPILLKKRLGVLETETDLSEELEVLSETIYRRIKAKNDSDITESTLEKLTSIYLATKHPDKLNNNSTSIDAYNQLKNQEKQLGEPADYLFYYWNHDIDAVEIAVLKLRIHENEWSGGQIYYLKSLEPNEQGFNWCSISEPRPLLISNPIPNTETTTIITGPRGSDETSLTSQRMFLSGFRILTNNVPAIKRNIMMGSYCVAMSNGKNPASGIGVFARIGDEKKGNFALGINEDTEECLLTLMNDKLYAKHRIPDVIINLLFDRRDALREIKTREEDYSENKVFNSFDELPNQPNVNAIYEVAGLYFGYHLQNDHRRGSSQTMGALRTVILEIHPSGICYLLDDEKHLNPIKKSYFGFLNMRDYARKRILINLDRERGGYTEYHSWRVQMYLEQKSQHVLEGVTSGFSKLGSLPITSPIRFKKSNKFKSIEEVLTAKDNGDHSCSIFPISFFKSDYIKQPDHPDLTALIEWDDEVIPYFSSIYNNKYFNSPHHSLPHNFINLSYQDYINFHRLEGNYYLVSHSHGSGAPAISKVKVQLRKYGESIFVYNEKTKNKLDLFAGRWETHEEGAILKIRLKFRKRHGTNRSDLVEDVARSHGDFIFRLKKIEDIDSITYLQGASIWVNYEQGNTMVSKREFLFPATDNANFQTDPDNFIRTYQYKHLVEQLNTEEFFSDIRYFETSDQKINQERKEKFLTFAKEREKNLLVEDDKRWF